MDDIKPIKPPKFIAHGNVIDLAGFKTQLVVTKRTDECSHTRTGYSRTERKVWCKDCNTELDSFDVFLRLVDHYARATARLESEKERFQEQRNKALRSIAAKSFDDIYRSRKYVPACPHCKEALLPEDVANGLAMVCRETARERRKFKRDQNK